MTHTHLSAGRISPEFYLSDHFLVVSSTPRRPHSSLTNTYVGTGGADWSFEAVTSFLYRPLTSRHITLRNSKVSVTSQVCSSNPTAHPPIHLITPLHSFSHSIFVTCRDKKKKKDESNNGARDISWYLKEEHWLHLKIIANY